MTYDEVCEKAHKAVSRKTLTKLTKGMTLMERATFVQALSAHVDFLTRCIYQQENQQPPSLEE